MPWRAPIALMPVRACVRACALQVAEAVRKVFLKEGAECVRIIIVEGAPGAERQSMHLEN